MPLLKPLPKRLVVVASEAVAAEGSKDHIIINRTLRFFPTARVASTGIDSGSDAEMDAGMDAYMNPGVEIGTEAGMKASMDAGMKASMDPWLDSNIDAGMDTSMDPGVHAATDVSMYAGRGCKHGAGTTLETIRTYPTYP